MTIGNPEEISQWVFDPIAAEVMVGRIAVYTYINYVKTLLTNEHAEGIITDAHRNRRLATIGLVSTGLETVTYLVHFDENIMQRYHYAATKWDSWDTENSWYETVFFLERKNISISNNHTWSGSIAGLFIISADIGMMVGPKRWLGTHAGAKIGNFAKRLHLSPTQSDGPWSYLAKKYLLHTPFFSMSLSSLEQGFLPTSGDLRPFRFPNCDLCFYGTNAAGWDGPLFKPWRLASRDNNKDYHRKILFNNEPILRNTSRPLRSNDTLPRFNNTIPQANTSLPRVKIN